MTIDPAPLWQQDLPPDLDRQLTELFAAAAELHGPVRVFFRADDIGRMDSSFVRMMELFAAYDIPLCPALVPQWLNSETWQQISSITQKKQKLCWHQHGFSHTNHEQTGKKCEFGQGRSSDAIRADILAGKMILKELLGNLFLPVFTPPWNRCSAATMDILQELKFAALSRSSNVQPSPPAGLPDLRINIDLHTRRETDPRDGMQSLITECKAALNNGCMGFMLHHQRMNTTAFIFLENLFRAINAAANLVPCTFLELLEEEHNRRGAEDAELQ
jgi:hypothetical protein